MVEQVIGGFVINIAYLIWFMASLLSKFLGFKVKKGCFHSSIPFLIYHAVFGERGTISSKYLSSRTPQMALLECKFALGKSQAINDIPYFHQLGPLGPLSFSMASVL